MTEIISASMRTLTSVERNTEMLLPLLSLLNTPHGPDRIAQLLKLLTHIVDAQNRRQRL